MSAKASVKLMLPGGEASQQGGNPRLFKWVAILTGSKNTLKGAGFFVGGMLLSLVGFRDALYILAGALLVVLLVTWWLLPGDIGKMKYKAKFSQVFSNSPAINWLSSARFFLFGARDVWFVVALPVYLGASLGWSHGEVGAFLALWVSGYGLVQASAPALLRRERHGNGPDASSSRLWIFGLAVVPALIAALLAINMDPGVVLVIGLLLFGVVFAINSAIHSYLVLAYADHDRVSMNVGFYYMANAGGRLVGTVLSGLVFQLWGLVACLWVSAGFVIIAGLLSLALPSVNPSPVVASGTD